MDWPAFTAWLEADPRHRSAYDEIALLDGRLNSVRAELLTEEAKTASERRSRPRLGRWAGAGAGALAAAVAVLVAFQPGSAPVTVQDYRAQAQSRQVALGDGTQVTLAPASDLKVSGEQLSLSGAAYFEVPHRPGRTLTVRAGDFVLRDIGTRFALENWEDGVSIGVAEGALTVESAALQAPIPLTAGHGLAADTRSGSVQLTTVEPGQVASWRSGHLQFEGVPLALVARDVTRYSGEKVMVDPAIADRPFSGVIAIDHGSSPGRALAQILSLEARPIHGGVRLEPRGR